MSKTSKVLKSIATGEEYRALVAAIEGSDYQNIFNAYMRIAGLLVEAEKQIQEQIKNLPRGGKDEDFQSFRSAFASRANTTLPQWYWLNSELKKQKIMEGEVFGFGSKRDPLVRTPEGRVVVVRDASAKEGEKVRFKVVAEGEKVDFGRMFELTPDSFYFVLCQDVRDKIRDSLNLVKERLENLPASTTESDLSQLSELLKELEDIRELTSKLQAEEKERTIARIMSYRRRLLKASIEKLAFDYLSQEEEQQIKESCRGDEQEIARALSAPGIFRYQSHEAAKAELFDGDQLKAYPEILGKLESNIDSMKAAVELMEFRAGVEGLNPAAKRYFERMDRFFERFSFKARQVAFTAAENKICHAEDIWATVREAFNNEARYAELRRAFRSSQEFSDLRGAVVELRTRLGNKESAQAEAALKPYLRQNIAAAFHGR